MRRLGRVCLVTLLAAGLVACQEAVDDDTAERARARLATNIASVQETSRTLIGQIDAVPNVQFSRGIASAVGNTYGSFGAVVRDVRVPGDALPELRAVQSAAGAVQSYGSRAGKATTDGEFALLVAAAKQKIAEFDAAAVVLLAKLDQINDD